MIGEDDQRIVDMGCGEGILLEKLVQRVQTKNGWAMSLYLNAEGWLYY
jgi:predicted TPR repeat methyltransferase